PIHASGHGYEEELKLMLNLVRPRYVMPAHGDHKRIHLHGQLAEAVGVRGDRIFKLENGLPLAIDEREVIFRGVPFPNEAERLLGDIRDTVEASLARAAEEEIRETDLLQKILHDDLAEFVYDRLRRRPMVLPVVVEV